MIQFFTLSLCQHLGRREVSILLLSWAWLALAASHKHTHGHTTKLTQYSLNMTGPENVTFVCQFMDFCFFFFASYQHLFVFCVSLCCAPYREVKACVNKSAQVVRNMKMYSFDSKLPPVIITADAWHKVTCSIKHLETTHWSSVDIKRNARKCVIMCIILNRNYNIDKMIQLHTDTEQQLTYHLLL